MKRKRVLAWDDPAIGAAAMPGMSGLEYLHSMMGKKLPPPPMGELLNMTLVDAAPGTATFTCHPDESPSAIGTMESGARLTPRTKHGRRSLSHEQRLELRKSAEQVGEAAHPVAHGLVRQREVGAGARLDTGEAPEDVPPRVPQPAADHEHKPAWT